MTAISFEQGVNNAMAVIKALKITMKGHVAPTPGHFENFITDGAFDVAITLERLWKVVGKSVKLEEIGAVVTDGCLLIPRSASRASKLCSDGASSIVFYQWDTPAYLAVPLTNKKQSRLESQIQNGFIPFTIPTDQLLDPDKPLKNIPATKSNPTVEETLEHWTQVGLKTVTVEQYNERLAVCEKCEYYEGGGSMGAGRCKQCGCSGSKLYMKAASCPVIKWRAVP